jgi:diguanylate cyclase (GGDEF)-like protein
MEHRGGIRRLRTAAVFVLLPGLVAIGAMLGAELGLPQLATWNAAWTTGAISALGAMLLARANAREENRSRLTLWSAATASWLVGQIAWDVFATSGTPASPNLADAGYWGFALLVIASLLRSRSRSRTVLAFTAIETLALIASAMALIFAELWADTSASSLSVIGRVSALAYPAVYVSAAVLTLQAMVGGSLRLARTPALTLVLGGIVAQAAAFISWSEQLLEQSYVPGATWLDPMWALGLLAIAAGGLLEWLRPERASSTEEPSHKGSILPAAMFVALLAALLHAATSHAPTGASITLATGLLFCGATLIVRSILLERRMQLLLSRERAALSNLAQRESELARLNERLTEDSRRDALTGMRNRWALADDLPRLDAVRDERGESFAIALCDIDHFKAYNDRLGHLAGDQALRAISATVRGALRTGDVAYRFGGEELLVVLPDTAAGQALAAAERVRAAVQDAAIPHVDGVGGVLTLSIGVAAGPGDSAKLLARADAALYEAKNAGRNRVIVAADSDRVHAVARPRNAVAEQPVPRHLRGMLAISRAAASGGGDMPVLEALAETIRRELSFQVVAVNMLGESGDALRVVLVLGDEEARAQLMDTVSPWNEWEPLLDSEHERGGAIWLPAGSKDYFEQTAVWTPAGAALPDPNAWHPLDMLLLPLRDSSGALLGIISVDQPLTGHRPDDAELSVLTAVADHAGLALEQARRDTGDATDNDRSQELLLAAVMLLAETLDLRDAGTGHHSRVVGDYARLVAEALSFGPERVARIHAAGVLHDLGKLGLSDAVLFKPGPLDDAEWAEIRQHPEIGARILERAGMLDIAGWVRAHHERVDGRGYPSGLPATQIPIEARILAVVDAYEAMTVDRPYRNAIAPAEAGEELRRCAGTQFDPVVVDAFLSALRRRGEPGLDELGSSRSAAA